MAILAYSKTKHKVLRWAHHDMTISGRQMHPDAPVLLIRIIDEQKSAVWKAQEGISKEILREKKPIKIGLEIKIQKFRHTRFLFASSYLELIVVRATTKLLEFQTGIFLNNSMENSILQKISYHLGCWSFMASLTLFIWPPSHYNEYTLYPLANLSIPNTFCLHLTPPLSLNIWYHV